METNDIRNEMPPVKVGFLVTSVLSDVQETVGWVMVKPEDQVKLNADNRRRLNFVKWLLNKYKDTSTEINSWKAEEEFRAFWANRFGPTVTLIPVTD